MADENDIIDDNRDKMHCPGCNTFVWTDKIRECSFCDETYCPECGDLGDEICNECIMARDESVDYSGREYEDDKS